MFSYLKNVLGEGLRSHYIAGAGLELPVNIDNATLELIEICCLSTPPPSTNTGIKGVIHPHLA